MSSTLSSINSSISSTRFPATSSETIPWPSLTLRYTLYFKMLSTARKKCWQTSGLRKKCISIRVETWFTPVRAKFPDFPWLSTRFPDFPEETLFPDSPWFSLLLGSLHKALVPIHFQLWPWETEILTEKMCRTFYFGNLHSHHGNVTHQGIFISQPRCGDKCMECMFERILSVSRHCGQSHTASRRYL